MPPLTRRMFGSYSVVVFNEPSRRCILYTVAATIVLVGTDCHLSSVTRLYFTWQLFWHGEELSCGPAIEVIDSDSPPSGMTILLPVDGQSAQHQEIHLPATYLSPRFVYFINGSGSEAISPEWMLS